MAMNTQTLTKRLVRKRTTRQWRRPAVIASVVFLAVVVLMAIFAPALTALSGSGPYEFHEDRIDPIRGGLPVGPLGGISLEHWLGVEPLNGRDIFARIVYGARVSLTIAISAAAATTVLGVFFGVLAGYFGGIVDQIVSRVMDFLMAFPALIFMIAILSALPQGNRPILLITVLALFGWPSTARVVRGQAMSVARREFVEAARASGAGRMTIVFREVLPNLGGTIIVMATLSIPTFVATEAGLSFLGVGVQPPTASWGQMISSAVPWYASDPMFFAIPGTFLTLTVLSFMVLGDTLQSALQRRSVTV
jgi:peptide/nickel transport system permease protein